MKWWSRLQTWRRVVLMLYALMLVSLILSVVFGPPNWVTFGSIAISGIISFVVFFANAREGLRAPIPTKANTTTED